MKHDLEVKESSIVQACSLGRQCDNGQAALLCWSDKEGKEKEQYGNATGRIDEEFLPKPLSTPEQDLGMRPLLN